MELLTLASQTDAPFAKLDLDQSAIADPSSGSGTRPLVLQSSGQPVNNETIVRAYEDTQLSLRCLVGANPLGTASILQIEWFKDEQKLEATQQQQQQKPINFQFSIERANHLHMGPSLAQRFASHNQQQHQPSPMMMLNTDSSQMLLASSKLLAASTLTLKTLSQASSGLYSCQFKIIPAPGATAAPPASAMGSQQQHATNNNQLQQQQSAKIISGRARQTIQVKVVEGR